MSSGWRKNSALPIGIEIGSTTVRAVQLRSGPQGLSVQACAVEQATLNSSDRKTEMMRALGRLLKPGTFSGRECVVSLSPDRVQTKSVRMPQMPDEDLKQAVQFEAQDRFGISAEECMIEHFRAGEVRRGNELRDEVLLFGLTNDVLHETIDAIEAARLNVHAIDLQPCAILRAINMQNRQFTSPVHTVVDFGDTQTQIIIQQDDRLAFYKCVDIGGLTLDNALAEKLGTSVTEATRLRIPFMNRSQSEPAEDNALEQAVSDAIRPLMDDLLRELDMCLRYYVVTFRGSRPEEATMTGAQSNALRLQQALAQSLGMHIETLAPIKDLRYSQQLGPQERLGQWAGALGLACYDLVGQEVSV